jgi:hypothetical protein
LRYGLLECDAIQFSRWFTIISNEPWRWSQHVSPKLTTKFCLKVKLKIVNKGVSVKSEWMSEQNLAGKILNVFSHLCTYGKLLSQTDLKVFPCSVNLEVCV